MSFIEKSWIILETENLVSVIENWIRNVTKNLEQNFPYKLNTFNIFINSTRNKRDQRLLAVAFDGGRADAGPTTTNYDVGSATWTDLRSAPLLSAMEVTNLGHEPSL